MKDRTLLLAGLVEEDDLETTRHAVVESYEDQLEKDRKNISEQVSFVEDDETRLIRLIGESEDEPEWEGKKPLNEAGIALGGYGPGFAGAPSYAISSHYTPSQSEAFGQILGGNYKNHKWQDIENPKAKLFQKIAEMNPGAFGFGAETINEDELPEFDENFNPILSENEETINFFSDDLSDKASALHEKIANGELAVEGGIGPGFTAYDGVQKEIKNPYENAESVMSHWYLSEEMKEQPDLPGELEDIEMGEEYPQTINLATMTLNLVGEDQGTHVYQIDGDDAMVGVSKDVDGYYAEVRDAIMGILGEGTGSTAEEAIQAATAGYTGNQQEMPSTLEDPAALGELGPKLMERVEGTPGNAWFYRRTGTPDDYYVRFREDGQSTMHPEAPEEPSDEAWPGMTGWKFYEADPTYQKMQAQMDDVLDVGETDATAEVMQKFFEKYSVYEK